MAITAATSSSNRIKVSVQAKTMFNDGQIAAGTNSWKQGELLCYDTSAHTLRVVAATTDAETLVGISDNEVKSGKIAGPYDGLTAVDGAQSGPKFAGPKFGVLASLTLKAGDAFRPGDKVYLVDGADTSTVSITDPGLTGHTGNYVGIFQGALVASAAAGQQGDVLVGCRYPSPNQADLHF